MMAIEYWTRYQNLEKVGNCSDIDEAWPDSSIRGICLRPCSVYDQPGEGLHVRMQRLIVGQFLGESLFANHGFTQDWGDAASLNLA